MVFINGSAPKNMLEHELHDGDTVEFVMGSVEDKKPCNKKKRCPQKEDSLMTACCHRYAVHPQGYQSEHQHQNIYGKTDAFDWNYSAISYMLYK